MASCIRIKGPTDDDGNYLSRPYTPTSTVSKLGSFELVIKSYPEGKVSKFLHALKVNLSILY